MKTHIDNVVLGVDTAIPCGLIINELVSNALKYAFPNNQGGEICIDLRTTSDQKFTLVVKDNGAGFPEDLDFRKTSSLGLRLVNTLVKQLRGNIDLARDSGTQFRIEFAAVN